MQRWLALAALVLRIILWPVRWLSSALFTGSDLDGLSDAVTAKAAQQFVVLLQSIAQSQATPATMESSNHSSQNVAIARAWNTVGFTSMQQEAVQTQSLIFVYLHSPLHRSATAFCRDTLLHPAMIEWLGQHGVQALGVSIHTAQGAHLASLLQATAFPVIALLHPKSTTSMSLIFKAQGPVLTQNFYMDHFLPNLQAALHRHLGVVAEHEMRRLQREQEAELRRQQDDEYHETLRQDQERERLQQVEMEQERKVQSAEDERVRQDEQEAQATIAKAESLVRPEPASGGAMVRFVLPSGTKLNRRFGSDETMAALQAFLRLHVHEKGLDMGRIGLSTNFPRKTYNEHDDQTLEELGLIPQAVLMVQDLDA